MILHNSLTRTSTYIISAEIFFKKSINITFKWCISTFFLFLSNLISLFILCLLRLELLDSFHLVSRFLIVSCSLTAYCLCWLRCVKLSLHYENIDNVYIYIYIYTKIKKPETRCVRVNIK